MILLCDNSAYPVLMIGVDGMHAIHPPGNNKRMWDHPLSQGEGLGYLRMSQGLGERRGKEPNPPLQKVNKGTVLHIFESEYSYEAVARL
jgi:hypothetical protein